ncbi:MAG: methyltransferase domain-containing protein [Chloroherpetonaceae bacterium]|nr:methyltransferase domain-containing protein [Chloroherpetonaceae bacterium]
MSESTLLGKASRFFKHALGKDNEEKWQEQYAKGEWAWLRNIDELAHHSILAGYFLYLKHGGSLLDMGCGEGLLQERLNPNDYSEYLGIDFSEPIKIASLKNTEKTRFEIGDMNTFSTSKLFDAIAFNESIYYLEKVGEAFQRYENFLKPDGVFLVSIFEKGNHQPIWNELQAKYEVLDSVTVTNSVGTGWTCKVLARRGSISVPKIQKPSK